MPQLVAAPAPAARTTLVEAGSKSAPPAPLGLFLPAATPPMPAPACSATQAQPARRVAQPVSPACQGAMAPRPLLQPALTAAQAQHRQRCRRPRPAPALRARLGGTLRWGARQPAAPAAQGAPRAAWAGQCAAGSAPQARTAAQRGRQRAKHVRWAAWRRLWGKPHAPPAARGAMQTPWACRSAACAAWAPFLAPWAPPATLRAPPASL
jgi:hypothetical protein